MSESDTDIIVRAIERSTERIETVLTDHERRLRKLETALAVQGWKIGAIVSAIVVFGSAMWQVALEKIKIMTGIK